MARGWVDAEIDMQGVNSIQFLRYERLGEGQFKLFRGGTDLARLRAAAEHITDHTERVFSLFRKIYREKGLENEQTKRHT